MLEISCDSGLISCKHETWQITSCQHGGEDDATRPDVCRLSFVLSLTEQLWGNVRKSPTQAIQKSLVSLVAKHGGQAKICQLQVI